MVFVAGAAHEPHRKHAGFDGACLHWRAVRRDDGGGADVIALLIFPALLIVWAAVLWLTRVTDAKQILDWWDEGQGR